MLLYGKVLKYAENYNMFEYGGTVIAGVSGGADSVCLLSLLKRMQLNVVVAHINHKIRETAERDARFTQKLAEQFGFPFELLEADALKYAQDKKISCELAGREIRYSFFENLKSKYNAYCIATAHNKNDLAETVLLHLIRGSGPSGLCGILPNSRGIVRPLLCAERQEIENYLSAEGQSWCEDETNSEDIYTRNKIRHCILPEILKINPSFTDAVARLSEISSSENAYLNKIAENFLVFEEKNGIIYIDKLLLERADTVIAKRALTSLFHDKQSGDINKIYSLLSTQTGKKVNLSGGKTAELQYNKILLYKNEYEVPFYSYPLSEGENLIPEASLKITLSKTHKAGALCLKNGNYYARKRQPGDRFFPEGLIGSKSVSDFFTDKKIPRLVRDKTPLIVSEGKIAAVGNLRRDRLFIPENQDKLYMDFEMSDIIK